MSCSINSDSKLIKWTIKKETLKPLYPYLFYDKEIAGEIKLSIVNGDKDSVSAPKAIVNYHTHPLSCYFSEKTIYGVASSEDFRETVIFSLKGSVAHVIPALEGIYIIQVNPCILENLIHLDLLIPDVKEVMKLFRPKVQKKINNLKTKNGQKVPFIDFFRGLIIHIIEIYLRTSHAFRTVEFNLKYKVQISDFLNFINNFKISNIFSSDIVEGCTDIHCNQLWTFEDNLYKQTTFEKYVKDYESDAEVYYCDKHGNADFTKIFIPDLLNKKLLSFIQDLKLGTSCKYSQSFWNENWFHLQLIEHKVLIGPNKYIAYKDMDMKSQIQFIKTFQKQKDLLNNLEPIKLLNDEDLSFNFFNMSGSCSYDDVRDNIHSKSDKHKLELRLGSLKSKKSRKIKSSKFRIKNSFGFGSDTDIKNLKLTMIGAEGCSYCRDLESKLKEYYKDKKITDVTIIKKYGLNDIKDIVNFARENINKDINSIPILYYSDNQSEYNIIDHTKI